MENTQGWGIHLHGMYEIHMNTTQPVFCSNQGRYKLSVFTVDRRIELKEK
jgi:hypothetical protein